MGKKAKRGVRQNTWHKDPVSFVPHLEFHNIDEEGFLRGAYVAELRGGLKKTIRFDSGQYEAEHPGKKGWISRIYVHLVRGKYDAGTIDLMVGSKKGGGVYVHAYSITDEYQRKEWLIIDWVHSAITVLKNNVSELRFLTTDDALVKTILR